MMFQTGIYCPEEKSSKTVFSSGTYRVTKSKCRDAHCWLGGSWLLLCTRKTRKSQV